MSYTELKRQVIEDRVDEDWLVERDGMLVCPCGHRVEDDGECPEGHVSPLRRMGLI